MNKQSGFTVFELVVCLGAAVGVFFLAALAYALIHFLAKIW